MEHTSQIVQIRKSCLITYTDYSTITRIKEAKPIVKSGTYTNSAKKKFKKYLDLWSYTIEHTDRKISFITLTISSEQKQEINYTIRLKRLLEKLKTRYNEFNYCWKIEYQKNNNIHFHIIIDKEIDWKIVRSQWNKQQQEHVNDYQLKMKQKYKFGYYYDENLKKYNGETVDNETQLKRYNKGKKANWRNPNSTDVKIETNTQAIGNYINKYINKKEEQDETINKDKQTVRFYGVSDTIRNLKYATIEDYKLNTESYELIGNNILKEIKSDKGKYLCNIIDKVGTEQLRELEHLQIELNKTTLNYNNNNNNDKLINKEIQNYNKLWETTDIF